MRHRYLHLDPALLQDILERLDLGRLFQQLVLRTGADAEAAMEWMRELQRLGHLPEDLDLEAFFASLEEERLLDRSDEGGVRLSGGGHRRIRRSAFEEVFSGLRRGDAGYHPVRAAGDGGERLPETRPWAFGDDIERIDTRRSLDNALRRTHGALDSLREEDLEVHETEHLTSCATIVAIDVSHSMILYGEDRITPAKTVALALTELVTTKYPKDHLGVVLFGDRAREVALADIPGIQAGPFHTNTREALALSRALLARQKQPNRQIFLITDGKPSAITRGGTVYKNPFGLDLEIVNRTLEEADLCRRQKIVITTFMLATDPPLTDFVEKLTATNRGRAYFASPDHLGEFLFADYLRNRRHRVR